MDIQAAGPVRFQTITAIPNGGRSGQFAVTRDQHVEGTVVSVEGDTVVVSIGSQRVEARATGLRAGDQLRLLVREAGPDRVVMQIVARGDAGTTLRPLADADLREELGRAGVPADGPSLAVARELIAAGQAVTAESVLDVRAALARARALDPQSLRAAVFLKAQGLPLTPSTLQLARQALAASSTALGEQVQQLRESLAALATRLAAGASLPSDQDALSASPPASDVDSAVSGDEAQIASALPLGEGQGESAVEMGAAPRATTGRPSPALDDADAAAGAGPGTATSAEAASPEPGTTPPPSPRGRGDAVGASAAGGSAAGASDADPSATGSGASAPPAPAVAATPDAAPATPSARDGSAPASAAGPPASQAVPSGPAAPPGQSTAGATLEPATPRAASPSGDAAPSVDAAVAGDASDAAPGPPSPAPPATSPPRPLDAGAPSHDGPIQPPDDPTSASSAAAPAPSAGPAPDAGGPAGLVRLVDRIAHTLSTLPSLDDTTVRAGREHLAATIHRIVADQSTPVEAKLARLLDGLATRADLEAALSTDLRSTLADLVDDAGRQVANPHLPAEARGDLQIVRDRAEALLGKIDLQQISNAANAAKPGESYVVIQFPMPGRGGPETAEIRVRQDGQRARIDPHDAHVVFQFQLQGLQTVRVSLRVLQRHLSCQVGSSDPAATELLRQHAPELRAGLGGLGYLVDDVRCALLTPDELAPPAASAAEAAPATPRRVLRLDARA